MIIHEDEGRRPSLVLIAELDSDCNAITHLHAIFHIVHIHSYLSHTQTLRTYSHRIQLVLVARVVAKVEQVRL